MTDEEHDAHRIRTTATMMGVSLEEAERHLDSFHGPSWRYTYKREHGLFLTDAELAIRRAESDKELAGHRERMKHIHIDDFVKMVMPDFDIGPDEPEDPPPYVPNDPPDAVDKYLAMVEEQESKREAQTAKPTSSEIGDNSDG